MLVKQDEMRASKAMQHRVNSLDNMKSVIILKWDTVWVSSKWL